MRLGFVGRPSSLVSFALRTFLTIALLLLSRAASAAEVKPGQVITPANASEVAGLTARAI